MIWAWQFWCAFCGLLLELILGRHGWCAPVVLLIAFHFTVVLGWRAALIPGLITGALLDLMLGRDLPVTVLLLPPVLLAGLFWRRHGDCQHTVAQILPGAAVGLVAGTGLVLCVSLPAEHWHVSLFLHNFRLLLGCVAWGTLLLPLLCWILNRFARGMALRGYESVQRQEVSDGH